MTIATKYDVQTAWRTLFTNVFQLTRGDSTTPATYRGTVKAEDFNNPRAGYKEIGYFLIDFWGTPYSIIAVGTNTIDVSDDFQTGKCPTSSKMAIVYQSVFHGRALYLSPIDFQFLHPLAFSNSRKFDMALIWANDPNPKQIPFTATDTPTITGYQSAQLDGFNLSEDYGENPKVQCMIIDDSNNRHIRQQDAQFTYISGLINTIYFDLGTPATGYIIISK